MTGSVRWTLSSLVIHSIKQEFRDKKQIQSRDKTVQVMWNKPVFLLSLKRGSTLVMRRDGMKVEGPGGAGEEAICGSAVTAADFSLVVVMRCRI